MTTTMLKVNRTGIERAGELASEMLEVTERTEPSTMGDGMGLHENRIEYLLEGHEVGSPPPAVDADMALFLDKLGERLAFERMGVRLYQALCDKLEGGDGFPGGPSAGELEHIRREEAQHFLLLDEVIRQQGGDPTTMTPCADLVGVESMGVHHVVVDPRTTLAQGLHAILVAELADNAGWELLVELARHVGVEDAARRFQHALDEEQEHLRMVRGWVRAHAIGGDRERTAPPDLDTH